MTAAPIVRAVSRRAREWLNLEGIHREEPDLFDQSGDEPDHPTIRPVRDAVISALEKHLGDHYTRRPGLFPLCEAIADSLAAEDIAVDAENGVVITSGRSEARFIAFRAIAAGKAVYMPQPMCRSDYAAAALFANARIEPFEIDAFPARPCGVLLVSDPNPATGQLYTFDTLQQLARWACESNLLVICNEMLVPHLRPGMRLTRMASLPGMAERTLTLGTFNGMPSPDTWSLSWIAGSESLMASVRGMKLALSLCSPAVSQQAALIGISGTHVQDESRIQALEMLLRQHGVSYTEPHTIAFVVADVSALGGADVVSAALARAGVKVKNGREFGDPNYVRISTAVNHFDKALKRLDRALATLKDTSG